MSLIDGQTEFKLAVRDYVHSSRSLAGLKEVLPALEFDHIHEVH